MNQLRLNQDRIKHKFITRIIIGILIYCLSLQVIYGATEESLGNELVVEEAVDEVSGEESAEDAVSEEVDSQEEVKVVYDYSGTKEKSPEYVQFIESATSDIAMPIDIIINDQFLETDVDGMIINDTTYVPLRAVAQAFNMTEIIWDEEAYKALVGSHIGQLEFPINQNMLVVDGVVHMMETPNLIVNGRTMVPLRFIAELLGFKVDWDPLYYNVILSHDSLQVNPEMLGVRFYSLEELRIFSKLVMQEAGSVSYETKHGVASVVMNHLRDDYFEDTVYGVIYAVHKTPHFPPVYEEDFDQTIPNRESVLAAKRTLRGENSVDRCIYFNTSPFRGKTVYKVVDGVYFCY